MNRLLQIALLLPAILALIGATAPAGEIPQQAKPLPGWPEFVRFEHKIFRDEVASSQFPLRLPRIAAPVRQATWSNGSVTRQLDVIPEITSWQLTTKEPLLGTGLVTVEFDAPALLLDELAPIQPTADGSFWLAAHLATTVGEKLRYEPQPHKNTVGYWTQATDKATWRLQLNSPGSFNVAVLQGCGQGQGGSVARLTISLQSSNPSVADVPSPEEIQVQDFEVTETGHFQNFQWKQVQSVHLKRAGIYQLEVIPKEIRKNALMDIRSIQLVRIPN